MDITWTRQTKDITHFDLQWKIQTSTKMTATWQLNYYYSRSKNMLHHRIVSRFILKEERRKSYSPPWLNIWTFHHNTWLLVLHSNLPKKRQNGVAVPWWKGTVQCVLTHQELLQSKIDWYLVFQNCTVHINISFGSFWRGVIQELTREKLNLEVKYVDPLLWQTILNMIMHVIFHILAHKSPLALYEGWERFGCLLCGDSSSWVQPNDHAFRFAVEACHNLYFVLDTELLFCPPWGKRGEREIDKWGPHVSSNDQATSASMLMLVCHIRF